jgi:hypothetical protein
MRKKLLIFKMYARMNQIYDQPIEMKVTTTLSGNSTDPDIFGPPFWFVLHNAAVGYYDTPNGLAQDMMRNFLYSIPVIIPCIKCKEHAYTYLRMCDIDKAVQSRSALFKFFVDFHNYVNGKGGRPQMSLEDAKAMYGFFNYGQGGTMKITYT